MSLIKEFKSFISKGNVMDLAVAVIIGGAFGKIIASLVGDILMPLIGIIFGGIDFTGLTAQVGEATISYGLFIQSAIDFLIIAMCIFFIIKLLDNFKKKKETAPPEPGKEELLLAEIRDLLKEQNKN